MTNTNLSRNSRWTLPLAVLGAAAALAVGSVGAAALVSHPDVTGSGKVHACVAVDGATRIVPADTTCASAEDFQHLGMRLRGVYSQTAVYRTGDVVLTHDGTYVAQRRVRGVVPQDASEHWVAVTHPHKVIEPA